MCDNWLIKLLLIISHVVARGALGYICQISVPGPFFQIMGRVVNIFLEGLSSGEQRVLNEYCTDN